MTENRRQGTEDRLQMTDSRFQVSGVRNSDPQNLTPETPKLIPLGYALNFACLRSPNGGGG